MATGWERVARTKVYDGHYGVVVCSEAIIVQVIRQLQARAVGFVLLSGEKRWRAR